MLIIHSIAQAVGHDLHNVQREKGRVLHIKGEVKAINQRQFTGQSRLGHGAARAVIDERHFAENFAG